METTRDFFIYVSKLAGELLSQGTSLDAGQLDTIICRCNIHLGIFDNIITDFQLPPPFKDGLEQLIARLITWIGHASIHLESNRENKRKRYTRKPGRPTYDIPSEQIEGLRSMGFSWVKIADFLSVSKRTLRNKRAELQLSQKHSQILEMQLDTEMQTILTENPNMREKMLAGALLSRGVTVHREMLRKLIERVDPVGKVLWHLRKRAYNVSTTNALW